MFRSEQVSILAGTGRITAAGAVRVNLGVERSNNNGTGLQGIGVDFKKDFPSTPSSFTFANQYASNLSTTATTINPTTSGVGVYHAVTGSGTAYISETITVS